MALCASQFRSSGIDSGELNKMTKCVQATKELPCLKNLVKAKYDQEKVSAKQLASYGV